MTTIYNKANEGTGKGKKKPKPRESELVYLYEALGAIPEDAESVRSESTFRAPRRLGPDPNTEIGREAIRERKYFVWWLREEINGMGDVAELAGALVRH